MTVFAIRTSTRPNVLVLAATVLLSIFAISLVVADPGPRNASEIQFGPYP
jgi:hypothetical protein